MKEIGIVMNLYQNLIFFFIVNDLRKGAKQFIWRVKDGIRKISFNYFSVFIFCYAAKGQCKTVHDVRFSWRYFKKGGDSQSLSCLIWEGLKPELNQKDLKMHFLVNSQFIPKGIEDACRRQASEAPEQSSALWLGWRSAANTHAASKATGIASL